MTLYPVPALSARAGAALLVSMLTGCTHLLTTEHPVVPPSDGTRAYVASPEAPAGSGKGGQVVRIPGVRERLRWVALQEWDLWGSGRWQLGSNTLESPAGVPPKTEELPGYASRVLHYWYAFRNGRDFSAESFVFQDGTLMPWSAAFISYLMKTSGIGSELFPPSESHWTYIRAIMAAPNRAGFEALDATQQAPEVGDLVCAPRDGAPPLGFAQLLRLARQDREQGMAYHCDLVVEVAPHSVGAIGGNVFESVTWSVIERDARGLLQPTAERPWSVVLRNNLP